MSEADIHFEFYRHLQNSIENNPDHGTKTYETVVPEYGTNIQGFADLVLFEDGHEPALVIEAKRPTDNGEPRRDIDPYSPDVIHQAHDYASELGSPYFATYNGNRLVIFRTFEKGKPLLERSTKSYEIASVEKFADTLLDELDRIESGQAKWDSLDSAFIKRVRSLHDKIVPEIKRSLEEHLSKDEGFRQDFLSWANAQGIEFKDLSEDRKEEELENFADQSTYLLINKIIFYKILENSPTYEGDIHSLAISINRVREDLNEYFQDVVDRVDFEAVFEHDDIYSEIPLENVSNRMKEFISELEDQNLTQFNSDVVGRIYEGVIPPERRHDMGEYYTPPAICDLITSLTIDNAHDDVLDPACGSGGFLVSAYHRKKDLFAEPTGVHTKVLDGLYGIDINRFPAHLTAINLAIQDLSSYTKNVNIEVEDFFNVNPETMRFRREQASAEGSKTEDKVVQEVGVFDAVIGNPPYIRQENIDDKEHVRSHLKSANGENLSKRSDIYSYFITHGTEFLEEGGKLGFIISDRWLDTSYGADLQKFILNHYNIEAVIKFDKQAFEDALVDSSVIILQKEAEEEERNENTVKFLRLKKSLEVDEIVSLVEQDLEEEQLIRTDKYRLVTHIQESLLHEEKWSIFFTAPPIYFEIIANPNIIELGQVADLSYGIKSGANKFFCKRREELEELGLEDYTTPLLKASGQVNKIRFNEEDAKEWGMLDIHGFVEDALTSMDNNLGESKVSRVKEWLKENGHISLLEYIEWGEDKGYNDRTTCQSRDVWFDLGYLYYPRILMPEFTWQEQRVVWSDVDVVGTTQFYYINSERIDEKLLCALLNSRVTWLFSELLGRRAGGQGMTRSRIKVYEAKQLPLPDPNITENEQQNILTAFNELMEKEEELGDDHSLEAKEKERDNLDRAVLRTIGMEEKLDELKDAVRGLVKMREEGSGEHTEVLVKRVEEKEVIDLAGVSEARESVTLDDF